VTFDDEKISDFVEEIDDSQKNIYNLSDYSLHSLIKNII